MPLHHYVPQFLLRCFADENDQLRATSRGDLRDSHITAVRRAAAERGFYRIPTEELTPESKAGHDPESIERSLAEVEARASDDIRLIVAGNSPYTQDLHYRMATLIAMQLTRSPRFRSDYVGVANLAARALLKEKLTDDRLRRHLVDHGRSARHEDVAKFRKEVLEGDYRLVPSATHLVQETLKFGIVDLAPLMFSRTPRVLRFSEPLLLTSDVGAAPWSPNDPTPWSNGITNAHSIFMPLNRFTALALTIGGSPLDRVVQPIWATHSNFALANAAERWVYQHPEDNHLGHIELPQLGHDRWGRR